MDVDPRRVRLAELLALLSGGALLVALFAPWYETDAGARNAWQVLTVAEAPLALAGVFSVALFAVTLTQRSPALPVALGVWLALLGSIAALFATVRLVDLPGGTHGRDYGAWIGLAAAWGTALAGWLSIRDERPRRAEPASAPPAR